MARPILEAIKNALAKYLEEQGIEKLIALVISLFSKTTDQPVFAASDPEVAEIRANFEQLTDEEKQELSSGAYQPE